MATNVDYGLAIPESDQEFVILPDKAKVRFESTGPLMKYLDGEIAAWNGVDGAIRQAYVEARRLLDSAVQSVGDDGLKSGALKSVRRRFAQESVSVFAVQACISSKSKLGKCLLSYRQETKDQDVYQIKSVAAYCVAMGFSEFQFNAANSVWALAVADATIRFRGGGALADDIAGYRQELESLVALGAQQRTDYDNRIADFEAKKTAFDEDRKKQFEDDNVKFAEHLKAADDSAEEFKRKYQERIKVLEETYHKKLQLESPAEYWDKLAKSYLCRGWIFMFIAFLSGAVVFGWLMALLMDAECLPLFEHTKFDAVAIRGSLIFVALMSVAGYLIHLFTRIAISSFHLSRDYRERFQLTRVYLALIKGGDVANDENTRQIVLQSIFSRSDTGLLKGDHALTMPGVGELVKGNG